MILFVVCIFCTLIGLFIRMSIWRKWLKNDMCHYLQSSVFLPDMRAVSEMELLVKYSFHAVLSLDCSRFRPTGVRLRRRQFNILVIRLFLDLHTLKFSSVKWSEGFLRKKLKPHCGKRNNGTKARSTLTEWFSYSFYLLESEALPYVFNSVIGELTLIISLCIHPLIPNLRSVPVNVSLSPLNSAFWFVDHPLNELTDSLRFHLFSW